MKSIIAVLLLIFWSGLLFAQSEEPKKVEPAKPETQAISQAGTKEEPKTEELITIILDKEIMKSYINKLRDKGFLDEELTDAEIEVASRYPERVPMIAEISLAATLKSKELYNNDQSIPKDVYAHIFWSYWLTKEFGPEFAEELTDAHEVREIINSPAESAKDMKNNELGRNYALKGYSEEEVEQNIKTDPEVKRAPLW